MVREQKNISIMEGAFQSDRVIIECERGQVITLVKIAFCKGAIQSNYSRKYKPMNVYYHSYECSF